MPSTPSRETTARPEGYQGPNLSPAGLRLIPRELAGGVYALVANIPPKDNNGLVVGDHTALVVDAGVTGEVSRQIQQLAGELASKPVRYLVNTTYHGDHTFGNAAFPYDVVIVSSKANRENMSDLGYEKNVRSGNMYGDPALDSVHNWRLPDLIFENTAEIDLGGRAVQLFRFGPGNGPGDTIAYVPEARAAWTGNFLCHAGIAPMLLQGGPEPYIASLQHMRDDLPELETIIPGHGPVGNGREAIDWLIGYLGDLKTNVAELRARGYGEEQVLDECPSPFANGLDSRVIEALASYDIPQEQARKGLEDLMVHLHRLNVLVTYRVEAGETTG
jgi:cyclase